MITTHFVHSKHSLMVYLNLISMFYTNLQNKICWLKNCIKNCYVLCLYVYLTRTFFTGEILQVPKQQEEAPYKRAASQVKNVKKIKANKHMEAKPTFEEEAPLEIPVFPVEMYREVVVETEKEPELKSSNNVSEALAQCYEELEVSLPDQSSADHDYYRSPQGKVKVQIGREEYTDVETIWMKSEENSQVSTGITDYIVSESSVDEHPVSCCFYIVTTVQYDLFRT